MPYPACLVRVALLLTLVLSPALAAQEEPQTAFGEELDVTYLRSLLQESVIEVGFREAMRLRGIEDAAMPRPVPGQVRRRRSGRRSGSGS